MHSTTIVFFLLAAFVGFNSAYPFPFPAELQEIPAELQEGQVDLFDLEPAFDDEEVYLIPIRAKRATCDLGSISVKGFNAGHSLCAAHCIALGKRGGWCNSQAVCNCR